MPPFVTVRNESDGISYNIGRGGVLQILRRRNSDAHARDGVGGRAGIDVDLSVRMAANKGVFESCRCRGRQGVSIHAPVKGATRDYILAIK